MKTQVLIISLAILFLGIINCEKENTKPHSKRFFDKKKKWYITYHMNSCPYYNCTYTELYTIGEDTIINSFEYKKIFKITGKDEPKDTMLYGFGRESKDKKIYLLKNKQEVMYYDFGANVQDTIGDWVVNSIQTETYFDTERKKTELISMCTSDTSYWIEGIGSIDGLFTPKYFSCMDSIVAFVSGGSIYELNCVFKGDTKIFDSELYSDCWIFEPHRDDKE